MPTQPWILKPETAAESLRILKAVKAELILPDGKACDLAAALEGGDPCGHAEWSLKIHEVSFQLPEAGGELEVTSTPLFVWIIWVNSTPFAARVRTAVNDIGAVGDWKTLEVLGVNGLYSSGTNKTLTDLSSLLRLRKLRVLNCAKCSNLADLSGLAGLTALQSLDLSDCQSLGDLSALAGLTALQRLHLRECKSLSDLSVLAGLTELQSLDLVECKSLSDLSGLAGLTALQSLNLRKCKALTDLTPLAGLTGLQTLEVGGLEALTDLSVRVLAGLTALQDLDLSWCDSLSDLSVLAGLTALQNLYLSGCKSLSNLSGLAGLTGLQSLDLSNWESLSDLSGLAGLTGLQSLDLSGCKSLSNLSELAGLTALQSLRLGSCGSLSDLSVLAGLTALQSLDLNYCQALGDVSGLAGLTALQSLNLRYCQALGDVSGLAGLTALQSLDLGGCSSLSDVSVLAGLTGLQSLDLGGCSSLSDVSVLEGLTALQSLDLSFCGYVSNLSGLAGLTALQSLDLGYCESLSDLSGLAGLTALQTLNASNCNRVRTIETLRGCNDLRDLKVSIHPTILAELLADLAGKRRDLWIIQANASGWLKEAKSSLGENLPEAEVFAASLARAFALLGDTSTGDAFQTFLQSAPDFPVKPWKDWFLTTKRESGFDLLQRRIDAIPPAELSPGAIGGASAALPDDRASQPEQTWARTWLAAIEQHHADRGSALRPAAAELCLALARLGEFAALDRWLQRFTDPDDSTAVDQVHAALAEWKLAAGDGDAALAQLSAVVFSQFRDPVLAKLVRFWAPADAHRAMHTLLLLEDQTLRSQLVRELGAGEAGTASPEAVHRLLVAAGTDGGTLAWLIERVGELHPDQTVLDELESGMRASPDDLVGWQIQQLEKMRNKLVAERRMRVETRR